MTDVSEARRDARPSLTIGVPTFNRRRAVTELIRSVRGVVPVLVVDDGSTDGTGEGLLEMFGVEVVGHPTNQGYAWAFVKLLESCRTDYLLVAADDDLVRPAEIVRLEGWLAENRPDFVSTAWLTRDGHDYRGAPGIRAIQPKEVRRASGHAPGIVYRLGAVRPVLGLLKERMEAGDEAALVYPQVLIAFSLSAAGGGCWWWTGSPVVEGRALPSGIRSTARTSYTSPQARYLQLRSYLEFLERLDGSQTLQEIQAKKFYESVVASLPRRSELAVNVISAERLVTADPKTIGRLLRIALRHGIRAGIRGAAGRIGRKSHPSGT